jgi:hypothetical protein
LLEALPQVVVVKTFMETPTPNREGDGGNRGGAAATEQSLTTTVPAAELSPLNIIRTEITLSQFPIHNLSKKGRVNIQIIKKTDKGEIDMKWIVSHNSLYGHPGQLAYKLDSVIINRRIDEVRSEQRQLPDLIRLGSLHQISQELGLKRDTNSVRKALRQNAGAFIDAKIRYVTNDGTERELAFSDTRYGVIFTGEKFPDGRKADSVYINLHSFYREVLNSSRVRPLDYDYLKSLRPAPQRFYEIISRKFFAALKYDHPTAKLSYSEFCTFSAQQRAFDYDHFKKQMYKVHLPHLKSGYIAKVEYQVATDKEGRADWIMLYTPGEKARAEFQTFNGLPVTRRRGRQKKIGGAIEANAPVVSPVAEMPARLPSTQSEKGTVDQQLLAELTTCGIFESEAVKLLAGMSPEQLERVGDYIDYWRQIPGEKTAGLLHSLIKKGDLLPPSFETRRRREERRVAEERRQKLLLVKQTLSNNYDEYRYNAIDRYIAEQLPAGEFERRVAEQKAKDAEQGNLWSRNTSPQFAEELARHAVRKTIADQVPMLSYEDFKKTELPKILGEFELTAVELGLDLPAANAPVRSDQTPQ